MNTVKTNTDDFAVAICNAAPNGNGELLTKINELLGSDIADPSQRSIFNFQALYKADGAPATKTDRYAANIINLAIKGSREGVALRLTGLMLDAASSTKSAKSAKKENLSRAVRCAFETGQVILSKTLGGMGGVTDQKDPAAQILKITTQEQAFEDLKSEFKRHPHDTYKNTKILARAIRQNLVNEIDMLAAIKDLGTKFNFTFRFLENGKWTSEDHAETFDLITTAIDAGREGTAVYLTQVMLRHPNLSTHDQRDILTHARDVAEAHDKTALVEFFGSKLKRMTALESANDGIVLASLVRTHSASPA